MEIYADISDGNWSWNIPIGSMYGIYANIGGILMVNVTIYSIHGSYGILMYIAYALGLVTAALQSARVTSAHLNLWLPWLLQQASPSSSDWFRMSQDAKRASDDPSPLMGFAHVTKQALYISL